MFVILSILIAIGGFSTASYFTIKAYHIAKKSAQDKISNHKKYSGASKHKHQSKYVLAK
ncbi:MAG: hypothetical protein JWQ63_2242 [Mucilaginibacter sp.]|jgi:hypothetical protein|nr:hypothetical protein [Mucilaginibacter sp.]